MRSCEIRSHTEKTLRHPSSIPEAADLQEPACPLYRPQPGTAMRQKPTCRQAPWQMKPSFAGVFRPHFCRFQATQAPEGTLVHFHAPQEGHEHLQDMREAHGNAPPGKSRPRPTALPIMKGRKSRVARMAGSVTPTASCSSNCSCFRRRCCSRRHPTAAAGARHSARLRSLGTSEAPRKLTKGDPAQPHTGPSLTKQPNSVVEAPSCPDHL